MSLSPAGGDPARRYPAFHDALTRGKRSGALDLKDPDGVAAVRRLAARADVLLEGSPACAPAVLPGHGRVAGPRRARGHRACAVTGRSHRRPARHDRRAHRPGRTGTR